MNAVGKFFGEWPLRIEDHAFLCSTFPKEPIVLDIGINRGGFAMEMIRRFRAVVYGAEPVSLLFHNLPKHHRLSAINAAITGRDMEVEINIFDERCASLIRKNDDIPAGVEKVPGFSLKTFMERIGVERADLAKIDIEGAEIDLIMEAPDNIIRRVDQYTIEFHDFMFPHLKKGVAETILKMKKSGYVCIKFSLDNTNVVFIKRELLSRMEELWLRVPVRFAQGAIRRLETFAAANGPA